MLYRNKNAKLVILKQNGCQLMICLVENAAKRKEEEEEEEEEEEDDDDDLIRFHLVCVSVEFYSCGMG